MPYTTNQLITNAYMAAGVISREFETLEGPQLANGLNWLNDILGEKVVDSGMIPYETTYDLDAVEGQEEYEIDNLIQINTLVFYLNDVRFAMSYTPRNEYFGSPRVENIQSLPFQWYFEKGLGGGKLYLYFLPDQNYPMQIHGIFRLTEVTIGQDLSETLDKFYITYLRYALADRICAEYSYATPSGVQKQLSKYESWIKNKSRVMDLRMQKSSTLAGGRSVNWAYVNLGRGWWP